MDKLREISDRLDKMTIHEVRQIARHLNVRSEGAQKGQIIDAILSLATGKTDPVPPSGRGAPPKSDMYDEQLVEDIRDYRNRLLNNGNEMQVEDGFGVKKKISGVLSCGEKCFISDGDIKIAVAQTLVLRYDLRCGDEVEGLAKISENGDTGMLITVDKINSLPFNGTTKRSRFEELTPIYAKDKLNLRGENSLPSTKMCDLFAPLAMGQRVYISSPLHGGKTTLIKEIAQGICSNYGNLKVVLLLLCCKPEEVCEFKRIFKDCKIFTADFSDSEIEKISTATLAFEYAKRRVELGENTVLICDGLFNIEYENIKPYLNCAINAEEGASLTVVSAIPQNYSHYDEVISTANTVITLSAELSAKRYFPAIDVAKTYSSREETLLEKEELACANRIRRTLSAEETVELFKSETYENIIKKYNNG